MNKILCTTVLYNNTRSRWNDNRHKSYKYISLAKTKQQIGVVNVYVLYSTIISYFILYLFTCVCVCMSLCVCDCNRFSYTYERVYFISYSMSASFFCQSNANSLKNCVCVCVCICMPAAKINHAYTPKAQSNVETVMMIAAQDDFCQYCHVRMHCRCVSYNQMDEICQSTIDRQRIYSGRVGSGNYRTYGTTQFCRFDGCWTSSRLFRIFVRSSSKVEKKEMIVKQKEREKEQIISGGKG